jgi:hypothetical protein
MQKCKACGAQKEPTEFYANDRTCKECRKAKVRANRDANIEKYRAYDRERSGLAHRVAGRLEYQQTEQGREACNRAKRNWIQRHPKQRAAHIAVGNAIKAGRLVPTPCVVCGGEHVEGHHPDYDAPLDVVWLCIPCHEEAHSLVQ